MKVTTAMVPASGIPRTKRGPADQNGAEERDDRDSEEVTAQGLQGALADRVGDLRR